MAGIVAIVLATAWTAFVVETIIESVRAFAVVVLLGTDLSSRGPRPEILIAVGSRHPPGSPGRPRSRTRADAGWSGGWPRSSTRATRR